MIPVVTWPPCCHETPLNAIDLSSLNSVKEHKSGNKAPVPSTPSRLSTATSAFKLLANRTSTEMAKTRYGLTQGYSKEYVTVAASLHIPLPSKQSCKMTSHPFSALSGQMSCEASVPTRRADRAQSLWSDTNLCGIHGDEHGQNLSFVAELQHSPVSSCGSSPSTAQHHYQHQPSDGRKHKLCFGRCFQQEKSHLCSSQENETHKAEQLHSPPSRAANGISVSLLGKMGIQSGALFSEYVCQHQLQQQTP